MPKKNTIKSIREKADDYLRNSSAQSPYLSIPWLTSWLEAYNTYHKLNFHIFENNGQLSGFIPLIA